MLFALLPALIPVTAGAQYPQDIQVVGVGSGVKSEIKASNVYDVVTPADYECVYDYTINSKNGNGEQFTESVNTVLQLSPGAAKYLDYTAFHVDSLMFTAGSSKDNPMFQKAKVSFTAEIFQNIPDGKTTYIDIVTPVFVSYKEDFAPFEWTLTEDTLTVCGYPCIKATCRYGGRDWEAWYTEEIPMGFGPWKFAGLPGLIMKVTDSEGVHTMTAISFRKASGFPIIRSRNVMIENTSRDKFLKMKKEFESDPMGSIAPESITEISVHDRNMIINGVPLPSRENGYVPVELE